MWPGRCSPSSSARWSGSRSLANARRRQRVELTRNPAGLIHALEKLQSNEQPLARSNQATAAMCIDDPSQHQQNRFHRLFDTHPPLAQRIAVLQGIAQGRTV